MQILAYLRHNCHVNTARAFAEQLQHMQTSSYTSGSSDGVKMITGLESGFGTRAIDQIQTHILWGRIKEATELLELYYPNVLQSTDPGRAPQQSEVPQPPPALQRRSSTTSAPRSSLFLYPLSLAPGHLTLNLKIQSFIEAVRTRPLEPPPLPSSFLTPHHSISVVSTYPSPSPTGTSTPDPSSASVPRRPQSQSLVLHLGKELAQIVNGLPDPTDRAVYLKELDGIWPLMAYPDPEHKSPSNVREYLQYDRRLRLAEQINSAILLRTGQNPRSALEHLVRSTGAIWDLAADKEVQIPADPKKYPFGVQPPPPPRAQGRMFVRQPDTQVRPSICVFSSGELTLKSTLSLIA
ncbi:hypothetical protein DL93DRAFT_2064872 [Clavulina sp. PMI_390]|nr:hypothetical protein DL93DRAFT_2064872 [Clavulina sp. PMI_390]